jgi:hypothetical protein
MLACDESTSIACAREMRGQQFHGEGGDAAGDEPVERLVRRQQADQETPPAQQPELLRLRLPHLQDDVSLVGVGGGGNDASAGRLVVAVADRRAFTGTCLDDHGVAAARHELFHGFRGGGYTRFARVDFGWYADLHRVEPLSSDP